MSSSSSLVVFLYSCTFFIHLVFFIFLFFSCCAIFVLIHSNYTSKFYYHIDAHTYTHVNHMQLNHFFCRACVYLSLCSFSSSLVFWLSLPTSHSWSLFLFFLRNMLDSTVYSFAVIVHIFLHSISLPLFLFFCCVRARCLERIYIHYIMHSDECARKIISVGSDSSRRKI